MRSNDCWLAIRLVADRRDTSLTQKRGRAKTQRVSASLFAALPVFVPLGQMMDLIAFGDPGCARQNCQNWQGEVWSRLGGRWHWLVDAFHDEFDFGRGGGVFGGEELLDVALRLALFGVFVKLSPFCRMGRSSIMLPN